MPFTGPPLEQPVSPTDILKSGLEKKPNDLALMSLEQRWSWSELDQACARLAGNLLALGLKPGDRVASLMPNRCELVIHYLACLRAGLVATPLNYRYMAPEIDHALDIAEPSILLAHHERSRDLTLSKLACRLPLGRVTYGGDGPGTTFHELIRSEPPARELLPPSADCPAVIFFTSGSTGAPKGVTHSFETLGWTIESFRTASMLSPKDAILSGTSLSHGGAFKFALAGFAAGARVMVLRHLDSEPLLQLLRQSRPSVLHMLPSALLALIRDHGATMEDFSSVRSCVSVGDKASSELMREFTDLTGLELREGYGMTEVGGISINGPLTDYRPGSVGKVFPGATVVLRDENGSEAPVGQEGRLWVRSPSLMTGYWNNPAASEATIQDGWLDSGDILRIDQDGYFWFRGRSKQIIVHDGSNISPQEVESALLEHTTVAAAGVVGVHDPMHGENVRAYIELRPGADQPSDQELIRFARDRVGYKAPEEIRVLEAIPYTATGKVDRTALKRLASQEKG
ncbi:MAG: class I adenylate-forming enzyme family protein [Pseudomonadota bacterium]